MTKIKSALFAMIPAVALAMAPVGNAEAHEHGHFFGPVGFLAAAAVGVAAAVITAPVRVVEAVAAPQPVYAPPSGYYPAPVYYQPQPVYAPPPVYYQAAPGPFYYRR